MKITVELGLTLPIREEAREFIRPLVRMQDIDTDGDIEEQIQKGLSVSAKVWEAEVEFLNEKLSEILESPTVDLQPVLREAINQLDVRLARVENALLTKKKERKKKEEDAR